MKLWQKIVMASTALIAVAALTVCGVLLVNQHNEQSKTVAALAQAEQAQTERDEYKAQAEGSEKAGEELQKQLDQLQKKKAELEEKLKKSEEENKSLKDKNASLQQQVELMSANKTPQSVKPIPGKVCYLTFDDGPSEITPQVLDVLKKYNVKATFFVVGTGNLNYLQRIKNEGHAIALHCNNHTYRKVYASEAAYLADLNALSKKVQDKTGVKSMVVRFPGGSSNTVSGTYTKGLMTRLTKLLPQMGYAYFDWNVDSGDADAGSVSAAKIASNVLKRSKGINKICVLMHDGAGKQTTAKALPTIIQGLKAQGYSFEVLTTGVTGFKHKTNN